MSNIRAEIVGVDLIQEYCKTNSIQKLIDLPSTISARGNKIKFTQKSPPMINEKPLRAVDFLDFNFRASYQMEQDYSVESNIAKNIINKWCHEFWFLRLSFKRNSKKNFHAKFLIL
jgi:hypothetical protein